MYGYIYKITNLINNKIYIGQTVRDIDTRFKEHLNESNKENLTSYIHLAIKKYGKENFKCTLIDTAENKEDLNFKEKFWIQYYNSNIDGYNLTPGGDINPIDVENIKLKHDRIMKKECTRVKISNSMKEYKKQNPVSEITRKKLSLRSKGKIYIHNSLNEEKKIYPENLSYFLEKGWKKGAAKDKEDIVKNRALKIRKKVCCIDINNNIIKTFSSVTEAATWWKSNGYENSSINNIMDMIRKSYKENKYIKNLKWIYKERR